MITVPVPIEVDYVYELVMSLTSADIQKDIASNVSILIKLSEIAKVKTGEKEKWDKVINELEEILKDIYNSLRCTILKSSLLNMGIEIMHGCDEKTEIEKLGERMKRLAEIESMIVLELNKLYYNYGGDQK